MSKVTRSIGILALALLTLGVSAASATAQVGAVKDAWLVMKLHSLFVPEDALSGSDIDVDVKDGAVTLQGTVPTEAARARALAMAKGADGVKGVTDQLRIAPAPAGMADKAAAMAERTVERSASGAKKAGRAVDDGWIKSKIYAQYLLEWGTVLEDSDIDVDVATGMVTLSGTVKSAAARTKAVSIAKATDGVKGVKDQLKVGTTH